MLAKRPRLDINSKQAPSGHSRSRRVEGTSFVEIDGVKVDTNRTCCADLRFYSFEDAAKAMFDLHGSTFEANGFEPTQIAIVSNDASKDNTKLVVHGLPHGIEWQELKDYFKRIGRIAYVAVRPSVVKEPTLTLSPGSLMGEVRYDRREHAQRALELLDGSILAGSKIALTLDTSSKDGTKLFVSGIPLGIEWQELKDHFSPIGTVGYAGIKGDGKGGGKGLGKLGGKSGSKSAFIGWDGGFKGYPSGAKATGKGSGW